mmetsp:Transcript_47900/g.76761  ORF Transcript_47900/g.76761 Transcript_47900/m.76761 type:complete len:131 (+) Transcript_47900:59-451(+)|eukprot:CAMPEP_0197034386 /NCGR_PEP_ID=MMETSP1384-20130603/12521_1 /TAXON_ID=29189 /ORGANISM="Ammonia sp." /LENGTH=130 /DNA_ID=CAMNT_0042464311 /DNA_START=48 /DNA_END=440 /DNA_ORIENTATION=+
MSAESVPSKIFCTQCGTQNQFQSNFCFQCGTGLQKQVIATDDKESKGKENEARRVELKASQRINGYNTSGKVTRMQSFHSEGDYGMGAVKQANDFMQQNPEISVLDIQHFVHPVVKFYVWVNVLYTTAEQ